MGRHYASVNAVMQNGACWPRWINTHPFKDVWATFRRAYLEISTHIFTDDNDGRTTAFLPLIFINELEAMRGPGVLCPKRCGSRAVEDHWQGWRCMMIRNDWVTLWRVEKLFVVVSAVLTTSRPKLFQAQSILLEVEGQGKVWHPCSVKILKPNFLGCIMAWPGHSFTSAAWVRGLTILLGFHLLCCSEFLSVHHSPLGIGCLYLDETLLVCYDM